MSLPISGHPEVLHRVRRADANAGTRPALTAEEREELRLLRREGRRPLTAAEFIAAYIGPAGGEG